MRLRAALYHRGGPSGGDISRSEARVRLPPAAIAHRGLHGAL